MGDAYEVSSGGRVVGPVSLEQMRQGVTAGMIPRDAQARPMGSASWRSVQEVLGIAPPPLPAAPLAPAPAAPTTATPIGDRNSNLLSASRMLCRYGDALKLVGIAIAAVGVLGAVFADGLAWKLMSLAIAFLAGLTMHVTGTFIAATGEGLLALADIAENTARAR
jgi:hypothetical protein